MKKGNIENSEAEIAERNERAKKLYRYVSDVARRIDEATAASHSIADLFTTYIEVQRQKVRDNCEKLMFLDPLNYGKKSLELCWRKVYYETVSAAKKFGETENEYDNYLFTHIVCGIGHFHHLITRIQSDLKIQFKELDYTPTYNDEESEDVEEILNDNELHQFGRSTLYSCLIYLGDLSRYQAEIFHTFDPTIAARYYLQAALIDLTSGMPYNQLGNLYQDKNHNLDSVCYYIQCLSCATPFDGALGNLTKLFEKNSQFVESLNNSDTLTQTEHVQITIANFLSLIEIWYLGKDDDEIPQRCNMIAQLLKISMDLNKLPLPDMDKNYTEYQQAVEEENMNPSYLNTNLIHKIVQVCLFTMAKMCEIDEKKAFACKAFTLALLSQLLQKLLQELESLGFKNPANRYRKRSTLVIESEPEKPNDIEEDIVNDEVEEPPSPVEEANKEIKEDQPLPSDKSDEESEILQNGDGKHNKKAMSKRRRRRRLASTDSSEVSDSESEHSEEYTDESGSEEYMSDSSFETEEKVKSVEDDDTKIVNPIEKQNGHANIVQDEKHPNEAIILNGDTKGNEIVKNKQGKAETKQEEKKELDSSAIQNFLRGDNFLPSIKLLQDWVLNEKELIISCGDSGESLFQCVVDLLNILTFYFKPKSSSKPTATCKIIDYARSIARKLKLEYRTIPLPEDVNLRGTNICKYDKDAAEWQLLNMYKSSVYEENVIRILKFLDFGDQIAKLVPRIRYNRSMQILYWKKIPVPKVNTKLNHKRTREWHNSKKPHPGSEAPVEGALIHRLGRLWLTSQVRELERYGRSAATAALTMLVLDSAALHKHLRRVKQLLRAKNFILLVPIVVLQELDDLKREQSTARDAIRWLEAQLQSGSRFLRSQRPGQSRQLPLIKYPRKAPPHIHNYIKILEFCHHFLADDKHGHLGSGDQEGSVHKSTPLLVLLTGNEPGFEEYKEFSVSGAAQTAGVTVTFIGDFYSKWRQTAHKSGKKR